MATPMGNESSFLSVTGSSARLESSSSQDSQLTWKKEAEENVMLFEQCWLFPALFKYLRKKKKTTHWLRFMCGQTLEIWENSLKAMRTPSSQGADFLNQLLYLFLVSQVPALQINRIYRPPKLG